MSVRTETGRVLIIDDDREGAEGLGALLETEGHEVFVETSTITLPMSIREIDPDLILLDLSMPALSGESFLRAGGKRVMKTDAPVLLYSGRARQQLSELTEHLGVDGFLSKSDDVLQIVRSVGVWIHRRRLLHAPAATASSVDL